MTRWPDSNGAVFRRYVQGLGLRTAMAARVYHCILRGFQQFVSDHDPACPVSQASVTAWLQDRITGVALTPGYSQSTFSRSFP